MFFKPDDTGAEPGDRPAEEPGAGSAKDLEGELTLLVYVPASDTLFWEHSCASGSAALANYAALMAGAAGNAIILRFALKPAR